MSETHLSVDVNEKSSKDINDGPKEELHSGINYEMSPFEHFWVFGHNTEVPALNLTTNGGAPRILYLASHMAIVYNFDDHTMTKLRGHKNKVTQIARDITGRWIVTSDSGKDNVIIIWDSNKGVPVHTIFDSYADGCDLIALSPCAKYLITVSYLPEQVLHLWEWAFGREKPDEMLIFDPEFGQIKTITFSQDVSEYVLITSEHHVTFLSYENGEFKSHVPDTNNKRTKKMKNIKFTGSTYVDGTDTRFAVSATNLGYVSLWSDIPPGENGDEIPVSIKKELIFNIRLSNKKITVICSMNKLIITADSSGRISLYDQRLRLKTYFDSFNLDSLTGLSFDPVNYNDKSGEINENLNTNHDSNIDNNSQIEKEDDKICSELNVSDSSNKNLLQGIKVIVTTKNGYVGYVDLTKNIIEYLLRPYGEPSAIDLHPLLTYFCVGTQDAALMLFDYNAKELKVDNILRYAPERSSKNVKDVSPITCLKYSPDGFFLACGQENGNLWLLNALILTTKSDHPYTNSKGSIIKAEFSGDSHFMAVADSKMCICLYSTRKEISFLGKYRSHYKTINDLTFFTSGDDFPNLFSVGEDRSLVEYDIEKSALISVAEERLLIKCTDRIDQCGVPLCVIPYYIERPSLILCNSQGKYRVIDISTKQCIKTAQEPVLSHPIHKIKILPSSENNQPEYLIYAAGSYIGIQKMPLDGNPFKTISILGSASKIKEMCCSIDGRFLFTINNSDSCINMWRIRKESVDILEQLGGPGLEPYYCMIDGGKFGPLMNDIKDFFYYCQIMHEGEHLQYERPVFSTISLCELANFMRAIGFYPTNYDLSNMLHEITHEFEVDKTGHRLHFDDLVRLFINHHPTTGFSEEILREAFKTFAENVSQDPDTGNPFIIRKNFFSVLEGTGEMFNRTETINYLNMLLSKSDDDEESNQKVPLPKEISFEFFCDELLGTWRCGPRNGARFLTHTSTNSL